MAEKFILFDQEMYVDDSLQLEILLRRAVMLAAQGAKKTFEEHYSHFNNIEGLLKKGEDEVIKIFTASAQFCVDTLTKLGVYSIAADDIVSSMRGSYFMGELGELEKWYLSVLQNEADKDAYRTARRKGRSKWVGYGFGIQGALTGAAKAGTLNMLSGAAHGTVNLIGKSFSMIGTSMNKSQMFQSKDTRNRLATALYMDISNWIYFLENAVQKEGYAVQEISPADEKRAESLFQNLKNPSLTHNQRYDIAFQLFETNPVVPEYYDYCVFQFPEQQKYLFQLGEYCGIDFSELKEKILQKIFDKASHKTEEETLQVYKKLQAKKADLGINDSKVITRTEKLLKDFDLEARTFRKIVYGTREIKAQAEREYNELLIICGDITSVAEEECQTLKLRISQGTYMVEVRDPFVHQLDCQIKRIEYNTAEAFYDELYRKSTIDNPKLKIAKSWWKVPLVVTLLSLIFFFAGAGHWRELEENFGIDYSFWHTALFWISGFLWIAARLYSKKIFEATASNELKDAKTERDRLLAEYTKQKHICEEDEEGKATISSPNMPVAPAEAKKEYTPEKEVTPVRPHLEEKQELIRRLINVLKQMDHVSDKDKGK